MNKKREGKNYRLLNELRKAPTVKCDICGGYITRNDFNCDGICTKCLLQKLQAFKNNGGTNEDIANMAKGRFITN